MPVVAWFHSDADPLQSGELRRLGLSALALESGEWRSRFLHAAQAPSAECDIAVLPLGALHALPDLARARPPLVVVEADRATLQAAPRLIETLALLAPRVDAVVSRNAVTRRDLRARLGPHLPVWLAPDPADRFAEVAAAAARFNLPTPQAQPWAGPQGGELWFAEPSDFIDSEEVVQLAEAWSVAGREPRVIVAPAPVREWLRQMGVAADFAASGPAALHGALTASARCVVPSGVGRSRVRRRRKAERYGLPLALADLQFGEQFDPAAVGQAWRGLFAQLLGAAGKPRQPPTVAVFMDLVQDLDLALPVIDELLARPDARLRLIVSRWLEERSPRVGAELDARGIAPELVGRGEVVRGSAPHLDGVDALLTVVETSDPAHARAHALFARARKRGIPTFSLQHGVENVGITFTGPAGEAEILSDAVFAWFPRERTPAWTPAAVRPRLVHVGRPRQRAKTNDVKAVFSEFDQVAAVFENLHWDRYDETFRRRFLEDCVEFAQAFPRTAVLLKPHHAGMWSARNRKAFPQWSANLVLADPSDPFWEPFTAPSLVEAADLVITTPSTVALDAALAAKPVAVAAYGMPLPAYEPLPMLQSAENWIAFAREGRSPDAARRSAEFVARSSLPGVAETAAASYLLALAERHARRRPA
ncbi:MAG TPA: hypothetical protein VF559_12660 [Caulobacteraceae bacterium]